MGIEWSYDNEIALTRCRIATRWWLSKTSRPKSNRFDAKPALAAAGPPGRSYFRRSFIECDACVDIVDDCITFTQTAKRPIYASG
jgi:hypothetical protein